jgi:hypothetical protein
MEYKKENMLNLEIDNLINFQFIHSSDGNKSLSIQNEFFSINSTTKIHSNARTRKGEMIEKWDRQNTFLTSYNCESVFPNNS